MSRRLQQGLYAGARGRATLLQASKAGTALVTPKIDGSYTVVSFASSGAVSAIVTRNGHLLPKGLASDFAGLRWIHDSILVCEAEVWTEAANRFAAKRPRQLWAFDAIRIAGQDVTHEDYAARRDWLMRAESWLIGEDLDKLPTDRQGKAHNAMGRYARQEARSWRRVRVVPSMPARFAERAWAEWVDQDGLDAPVEGLCLAALRGKLAGRGAAKKIKRVEEFDAVCISAGHSAATLLWSGRRVVVSNRSDMKIATGQWVSFRAEGFFDSGLPKHARLSRPRPDLSPGGNGAETRAPQPGEL